MLHLLVACQEILVLETFRSNARTAWRIAGKIATTILCMLGFLVPPEIANICERMVANERATSSIAWELAATILGVLGALVVRKTTLCFEYIVSGDVGAARDIAPEDRKTIS
eukprot:gnl/MRDRNA2_/MRDRNA2_54582_c0_seq1.p2 gnl/MRDRNA2_/MRDRNA2_54582_c0~~gnl/MRDRNA2_/MRDRNA2_54582_c0_seq1.p2  ORF type:complete len:112 (+),score=18.97 gnl/MRDRNA2_/MRDRNA2_54582_c0_seq1:433-768(+)